MPAFSYKMLPLLVLGILVTWSDASLDASTQSQIDHLVQAGMSCKELSGLALTVVKDGKTLMSKGYGVKDRTTQRPVTSDTLFQIASVTKAFTSALLSNVLAADPHHRISTTVHSSQAVPSSFRFNNTLRTTYATIEDLLAHRTGIPRNNYMRLANDYSIDTIVNKVRYLPSAGAFRDSFYYNDLMYGLAAHITESLGKQSWQQQVRDTIFHPLGMNNSTFISDIDFNSADVAIPHYVQGSGHVVNISIDFIKHWGRNTGSGGIFSSANDMAKWMLMLLNDGRDTSGGRVLRDGVLSEVFKPSNAIPPSSYAASYRRPSVPESFSGDTYALGWRLGYYREYKMIYHSGSTFGYRAFLTLLPDMNVGVVSLMTGDDDEYKFRTPLHEYMMDVALGYTPWINSSTICTFPDPWKSAHQSQQGSHKRDITEDDEDEDFFPRRQKRTRETQGRRATVDPNQYTGTFHHGAYGDLEVRLNPSTHVLELEYGIGLWRLSTTDGRHFHGHWLKDHPYIPMDFLFGASGQDITSVQALDFDSSKPPVFFRKAEGGSGGSLVG